MRIAALALLVLLSWVPGAVATPLPNALDLVQICADSAAHAGALEGVAAREGWQRLDDDSLLPFKASHFLASTIDHAWVVSDAFIVAISTQNDRLEALGRPLTEGGRPVAVQGCTVFAHGSGETTRDSLPRIRIFDAPIGPSPHPLDTGTRWGRRWALRSENGEAAYVFSEGGPNVAIVEIGRQISP